MILSISDVADLKKTIAEKFSSQIHIHDGCGGSKRQEIKQLIRRLKKSNSQIEKSIFNSTHSVCLDTMVGYKTNGEEHSFLERFNSIENN